MLLAKNLHLQNHESGLEGDGCFYHCVLCNYSTKAKLNLIQHVRSMKHQRTESFRKLKCLQKTLPEEEEDLGQIFTIQQCPATDTGKELVYLPLTLHVADTDEISDLSRAIGCFHQFWSLNLSGAGSLILATSDFQRSQLQSGRSTASIFWVEQLTDGLQIIRVSEADNETRVGSPDAAGAAKSWRVQGLLTSRSGLLEGCSWVEPIWVRGLPPWPRLVMEGEEEEEIEAWPLGWLKWGEPQLRLFGAGMNITGDGKGQPCPTAIASRDPLVGIAGWLAEFG
ncbi:hypothetical protein Chor_004820 [Crotalus horridus]